MITFDFWLFNLGWLATILFWIVAAILFSLLVIVLNNLIVRLHIIDKVVKFINRFLIV